jgi:hypothetical protein
MPVSIKADDDAAGKVFLAIQFHADGDPRFDISATLNLLLSQ